MGKASSAKKVARAARAGGSRRPGQRRQLGFPITIVAVVVAGVGLVGFAREQRSTNAEPRSAAAAEDADHWHAAYGMYFCDAFVPDEQAFTDQGEDALGIHTHADGVIHIHPFIDSAGGRNARLRLFFQQVGMSVSDSEWTMPAASGVEPLTWSEADTTCGDEAGQLVIARWASAQDAADGAKPTELITEDFGDIRFRVDREYYTLAFLPASYDFDSGVPVRPDVISDLSNLTDVPTEDLEAPPVTGGSDATTTSSTPASTSTSAGE